MGTIIFKKPNDPSLKSKTPRNKRMIKVLLACLTISMAVNAYFLIGK